MRFLGMAKAAAVMLLAAQTVMAGVVFTEDFQLATPGTLTIPVTPSTGSFSSGAHTYTTFGSAASNPTLAVTNFSGDLRLDNTAASGSSVESHIVTSFPAADPGKVITIEFDAYDPTNAGTSHQRFYLLMQNATSRDGYRVRFSSENNDEEVLNATLYNDGVEVADQKFDDEVDGPGTFGVPDVAGAWHVKMSFIRSGTDVTVAYEVTGISPTPDLLAANTFTFDEATFTGVDGVRDSFDQIDIAMRRPLGQIDNIVVTADTEGPAITLAGSPSVTLNCGDSYADAGATALDNFDGDVTGDIVVGGDTVNTAVPNTYTITYNVSDQSGNAAAEATRTVTVQNNCPAIIITPTTPTSVTVEEGAGPVTFGISAAGSGTLGYQWYADTGAKTPVSLPGENASDLTLAGPLAIANSGTYYCDVTDDFATVPSPVFTLTVTEQMPVAGLLGMLFGAGATALAGMAGLRRKR